MVAGKNIVILAPHVDDEVIGCFRQLSDRLVKKVYYFYEVDSVRATEAEASAVHFGFEPVFTYGDMTQIAPEPQGTIFMVPNINDAHPHHKKVNEFAKRALNNYELRYYSVDMNVKFDVLPKEDQFEKSRALYTLFPSQRKLLEDEKYHLFESDMSCDATKMIWVKFQREGIHAYPAALSDPKLADVSFLGHPHRHIFHFKISIEVEHNDRDIEFIQFKRWCEKLYSSGTLDLQSKSCEMIADELSLVIRSVKEYRGRKLIIEVSEDDENGCTVEYLA